MKLNVSNVVTFENIKGKLMTDDFATLEKWSENRIHPMKYASLYYEHWKVHKTDFLKSSAAPDFIKDILIYKNKKKPKAFFGEAYVAMILGSSTRKGWFNSWDWISSDDWSKGIYKSKDPFILQMMHQFYREALQKHLHTMMPKILDIQGHFSLKPEPPDLWLISRNGKHHFIEVKRGRNDRPSDEQLFGLLLINKILGHNIHIVWLYDEKQVKLPSDGKMTEYIEKYNELKNKLDDAIDKGGSAL